MSVREAQHVRPGEWIVEHHGEARRVTQVTHTMRGVTITCPPNPPVPRTLTDVVVVATAPPTCVPRWDEAGQLWHLTVYVPDGSEVAVSIAPDERGHDE